MPSSEPLENGRVMPESRDSSMSAMSQKSRSQTAKSNGTTVGTKNNESTVLQPRIRTESPARMSASVAPSPLWNKYNSKDMEGGSNDARTTAGANGDILRPSTTSVARYVNEPQKPSGTNGKAAVDARGSSQLSENGPQRAVNGSESLRSTPFAVTGANASVPDLTTAGTSTPPGRRSVQFARPALNTEQADHWYERRGSWEADDLETPGRDRGKQSGFFSKLQKAFGGHTGLQTHVRSQSGYTIGGSSIDETETPLGPLSPTSERGEPGYSATLEEEATDADAEESAGEDISSGHPPRRHTKRGRKSEGLRTEPSTPKSAVQDSRFQGRPSPAGVTPTDSFRPHFLGRRATMTDIPEQSNAVSDDEGRDRLEMESNLRRGGSWMHGGRGQSYHGARAQQPPQTPEGRRPSNFRRLTGFVIGNDAADGSPSPAPWHHLAERSTSVSAAKWRALKAGLKMMGQRKKEDSRVDHIKSAELMAELTAGVPAALMLASMFQRDEHGNKRIPILLEQLKVRITDSKTMERKASYRRMLLRIELEYGSGLTRMKWVIHRELRDFFNLHSRYKAQDVSNSLLGDQSAQQKLPHFPRLAIPYLRGGRHDPDEPELEDETGPSAGEGMASGPDGPGRKKSLRSSFNLTRRRSSVPDMAPAGATAALAASVGQMAGVVGQARRELPNERARRKMEIYLQQLIRQMIFRPDSNRLCKFLELSALGVRLAAEGSYHGKEGFLIIRSSKGLDFRRGWNPSLIMKRHAPKWFLVRHSYIVCVDSPEEMNIYDVFMADSEFTIEAKRNRLRDQKKAKDIAKSAKSNAAHPKNHHTLKIHNTERDVKLLAKNERQLQQFEDSIKFMISSTVWSKPQRFGSFAPARKGVFAQWLVDGRDYMWNVSRAISMARDVIYIHDWWLSPELYMRRPAAISQKWRLDRLLQRKASEGVKVFVIMYRNINSAVPIDSEYSKFSLLDLHSNIFVQRSPNQFRQGTFFWAHHEKICIVDHTVAFVGGIDLCLGRWDTPQHSVVDDKLTGFELSDAPKDADHCQLWPGKDYSNPRVQDFYALDKPYEEMYDRTKVPRMPWHDISMQVVGQPARDLTRHFVQRWNYILRQRKPSRPTPFILPPPDFVPADLEALGLDGTCEVQILRSCSPWSIGTQSHVEHSIMTAYVKMIEQSDHFVYIENQFFISSCEMEGTKIENTIGDALVERIVRTHRNGQDWRATIVIPLMPGFQNTVDSQDGTSVRLIMQCQYRSICRGSTSIFGRLRAQDIEPEDYIQFYSLRSWGKIGPTKMLVTEQLYIHAKCMVVDDRIAIIGSANINERSMLGSRDSECAAVVRDTDMLWSTMAGEPYLVGRFPHTLRMRLMREHLGLDVDEIMEEERQDAEHKEDSWESDMNKFHNGREEVTPEDSPTVDKATEEKLIQSQHNLQDEILKKSETLFSFNHDVDWEECDNPNTAPYKQQTKDKRVRRNEDHKLDIQGNGPDHMRQIMEAGLGDARDSVLIEERHEDKHKEVLICSLAPEGRGTLESPSKIKRHSAATSVASRTSPVETRANPTEPERNYGGIPPITQLPRMSTAELGLANLSQLPSLPVTDDTDIGGPPMQRVQSDSSSEMKEIVNSLFHEMRRPVVDKDCMKDPLNDSFYLDTWHATAENNTKLFRQVFRCMPDNEVKNWREYKEYVAYSERFAQAQAGAKSKTRMQQEAPGKSGPPGTGTALGLGVLGEKAGEYERKLGDIEGKMKDSVRGKGRKDQPMGTADEWADEARKARADRYEKEHELQDKDHLEKVGGSKGVEFDEKAAATRLSGETSQFPPLAFHTEGCEAEKLDRKSSPTDVPSLNHTPSKRRRRGTTRSSRKEFHASDDIMEYAEAEALMNMTQGSLVLWPYEWLANEEAGGNWLYSIDQLAPIEIYD